MTHLKRSGSSTVVTIIVLPARYLATEPLNHRRRIKPEEKAKVVASVWGKEFIQFLAALAVLYKDNLNNRMNCTRIV